MTKPRNPIACGVLAALVFGSGATGAFAGDIAGVVSESTGSTSLPGATVVITESGRSTTADSSGYYRFSDVPAGTYTLRSTFVGYDDKSQQVSVPATGTVTADFLMGGNVVQLEKFVVEGYREGRSRALQQKRNQSNISDIISSDAIGNLPDRNVAEAVSRLPGVNLSLDQGEGRYVSIRGAEPNLNQVLMDGAVMAAPGGSRLGRAVPLDTLSAGQISTIEVVKSVTPDLDANSIGGTLNIKSASAFDRKGQFIAGSVSAAKNGATDDINPGAQISYSNTFGPNNTWGIAASASYDKRDYSNEWVQVGWALNTANQVYLPNDFEIKPEWGNKKREGFNLNLEYRPDPDTQYYIRPGYSLANKYENTFEIIYSTNVNNVALTTPRSGTFGPTGSSGTRTERREFRNETDQDLFNISAGFKKIFGAFTLEPMVTFSTAKEDHVFDNSRQFRDGNNQTGPIQFDLGDGFVPTKWVVDPTIDVPSKYSLRRTRDDFGIIKEDTMTAKADLRWDSENIMGNPGYLKVGIKYLQRKRNSDLESRRLVSASSWTLADTGAQLPPVGVYGNRYSSLFLLNWDAINSYIAANPSKVQHDIEGEVSNSIEDDYKIDEYIYAGYVMGNIKFNRLTVLGGMRWERTDATIRAVEARTADGDLLGRFPTSGTTSYDKYFPNLQGVFHFTDSLQLRAAVTRTIGRPAYEDARPLASFEYDPIVNPTNPAFGYTGSLTVGNPALGPYDAMNYDLSLEWYGKSGGVVSVAAFRKEIDDPIYTFNETQMNVVHSGVGLESLSVSSKMNADSGRISGIEFNVYQPFRFLPDPFNGFGIDANYTVISSSEKIPTRPNEDIPFFRQPSKIANCTLFYERSNFSGRIAWTYAGEQIYTLGSGLLNDRYERPREQYDAQVRYRINRNYSVTFSVRNLTREPDEMSYGVKNLVQMSRLLDRDYKLSVDFNF